MAKLASPSIPVSWGEMLDKLTILEIKRQRITAAEARSNVVREYELLREIAAVVLHEADVADLVLRLRHVNEALWQIEDALRAAEAKAQFDHAFIELARSVYHRNDERAAIKRKINCALKSDLMEEKSYWSIREHAPAR